MSGALVWTAPALLVAAVPVLLLWWLRARQGHGSWLRLIWLLLLVLAAAGPEWRWGRGGSDVVFIADRSASLSAAARQAQEEVLRLLADERQDGDRLAVVAAARGQRVLQAPAAEGRPRLADAGLPADASDLAVALESALALVPPQRSGRIVLHSDGEQTGLDLRRVAAGAALRRIPVDVLPVSPPPAPDAAILAVEVPGHLRLGESFIGALRCLADQPTRRAYRIERDGVLIAEGTLHLQPERPTTVSFVDRPTRAGLAAYTVTLGQREAGSGAADDEQQQQPPADSRPANNRAHAALRVAGGERVLVMGGDGRPGNLVRALEAAGLAVDCVAEGPIGLDRLLAYRCLVLEQVPAHALGMASMHAIAEWVEDLGGGLLLTGGRRSFGGGGYHASPIEDIMPVTMELRDEHRKLSVALGVCLDRSGSMSAPVAGGQTKMDLANAGTCAAIELLGPHDQVAVYAVDTAPHEIVPLSQVGQRTAELCATVRTIESTGGGIYVYEALVAGGRAVLDGDRSTRHLVIFADAADAEQPADYQNLLADYQRQAITVSVIGLGSEADSDADFLKDVAARGGGRIWFCDRPDDLPRAFAQETTLIARSAWVDERVQPEPQPLIAAVLGQGEGLQADWPPVAGYNLVYPREGVLQLARAPGDPPGPALASWFVGAGRAAACTIDLDDPANTALRDWSGFVPLVAGLCRWLGAGGTEDIGLLQAERHGDQWRLQLELDPAQRRRWPTAAPQLALTGAGASAATILRPLQAVDDGRFEALLRLRDHRPLVPAAAWPEGETRVSVVGPGLCLPYSPEAEPRFGRRNGRDVLVDCATITGGQVRQDVIGAFDNPPSPGGWRSLIEPLLILAIVVFLAEIAVRRLQLGWTRRPLPATAVDEEAPTVAAPTPARPATTQASDTAIAPSAGTGLEAERGLHEALRQLRKHRRG